MQSQLVALAAIVAVCYCSHSSCPWDLRDPCASAASQAHDGDIAIPVIPSHPNSPNASESREKRAATSFTERLWPGAVVYYTMSNSFSSSHRQLIYRAMHQWESHTCIRFRPRTTQHSYVNFFPGSGCCSYVGMYNCGQQGISLGRCISMSNALHEIGHAVGFWHEQSRPDRDQYVKILFNNVIDGFEANFEKLPSSEINSLGVGYDFNSIMHYYHNSWSKYRNADTIQSKVPGIQVGAGEGLSPLDIEQANRLYRCDRDNPPPLAIIVPSLPTPPPPTKPFPCGEVFLAPSGSFHSPGYYHNDYRRNQECAWVIRGPEHHRLTLTFTGRMKDSFRNNCPRDYIEVTLAEDLKTQAFKFHRLCGRLISYDLYASENIAIVHYHTDGSSAGSNLRGFEATFRAYDYDECETPGYSGCDHFCHNTAGSYSCSCRDGWFLDGGGRRCFDMNECALGNGGCAHRCVNSAGSFGCECNTGYVLLSDGKSCGEENSQCRGSNGNCEQLCFSPVTPSGNPTCGCRGGYRLAADGVRCLDIDECTEGSHRCAHSCSNLPGSYSCSCRAGYQLNHNGYTCNNIDECSLGRDNCTHACRDTDGSYECGCPIGQKLAANNHTCEDVDECEEGSAKCSNGCRNTFGSYLCFCPLGFHLDADDATCIDQNECLSGSTNACDQRSGAMCMNTVGSYECTCRTGYVLDSNGISCTEENFNVIISVQYTRPDAFTPGPNEYRAASGPVTVTCTASGGGTGPISYLWSSTCGNCLFQSAKSRSIVRHAVHSGDNGTHTCVATRGRSTASASVDFHVVDAGLYVFWGSPRGNFPPDNGLVICDDPSARNDFRFRIICRSESQSRNVGELIGLDGTTALTNNVFFNIFNGQPGELRVQNVVGSQNALTTSQQGVYTCRIPLRSGVVREFNIGVYPSGFNVPPIVFALTSGSSSPTSLPILTCTSSGSPATSVTWTRDGKRLLVNGSTYQMMQQVTNRARATYENVLTINQPLASIIGSNFSCTVMNVLGSDSSDNLQITGFGPVNECETDNGGCAHICTDSPTSYQCSCRSGYTMDTNGRSCTDIDECDAMNGGCTQVCTNTLGSRECSCMPGYILTSNNMDCTENLTVSISVDYSPPSDFTPGPNEYRAASGPVTVTCTATGLGTGLISYQWSSTCSNCLFQSATSNLVKRAAVHSGDNGTHTCVASRGTSSASASIDFHVVDAGVHIFRGSPRGNFPPNNGLVISDNPAGNTLRFRLICRSDSASENVGEFIGLNGAIALTDNPFFIVSRPQPGELKVENTVGSQSALNIDQQGVYTCRIPLQSGVMREFNIGIYPSGFNTPPKVVAITSNSSLTLICTTTGSPATTVTWTEDGRPLTIDGDAYQMTQTVTDRATATYDNVLSISQPVASILGSIFSCRVTNVLGLDDSQNLEITAIGPVNECEADNGGCEHNCTDTHASFQCSCRTGYRLHTDDRACTDIDECSTNNGDCEQICTNTQGSRQCSCRPGFLLASNEMDCTEHLDISISVDYSPPSDFTPGPNETYRAASGPVTVTCTATGLGTGLISYQWSSTCRNCLFQSATSNSIKRGAVHSGDNGTHTCVASRGTSSASASIDFHVVDAGVHIFRGSPRGNFPPNNGLVISDNPAGNTLRFRIICRSDSESENVGEFVGLDGAIALTGNPYFIVSQPQPGELKVENTVGSQSALTIDQQGVYTCRIPLLSGVMREFNIGIYPNGFNTAPKVVAITSNSSLTLICTTTGSPATTVTWTKDGEPLTIDGEAYQMTQTVTDRATATYDNVLSISRPMTSILGNIFTCRVTNVLGSDVSQNLEITTIGPVNECEANNGGCEHNCTDTHASFQCSCRTGYRLHTDNRACTDIDECSTNNGDCEQICTNTQGSRQCGCRPGFLLASNEMDCTEHLNISISVDYIPPSDFTPGPNGYRAASGPVTVTCTATGLGTGLISYQWSSTCNNCLFQFATSNSIQRGAVHSGDNGTHTCVATRGASTASASIDFYVVDAGIHIFRGTARGSIPNNGLVITEMPELGFRLRIYCRSESVLENVGQFIGPDGTNFTDDNIFAIAHLQPGEMTIENIVGVQSALTSSQQGVYTCRMPIQNGEIKNINMGIYPTGFSVPPAIKNFTLASSNSLACTSTGSPATTVTWTRNGQPLTINESEYRMTQKVIDRHATTYESILIIDGYLDNSVDQTFTCTVRNDLGLDTSEMIIPTLSSPCGGVLSTDTGSIQSPNWPSSYPANVDCEWTVALTNPNQAIRFTFDYVYGIGGPSPCTADYVAILNGHEENAPLLGRFCSDSAPDPLTSSFGQAKIVFRAGPQHPESDRGFKITYQAVNRPPGQFSCGTGGLLSAGTPFGPPTFPHPITSSSSGSTCAWRFIGNPGTKARLRILYFDIPESDSCSENSLKIYNFSIALPAALSETLCGQLSQYEFTSFGNSMSVIMEIGSATGCRGVHAVFEQV